MPVLKKGRIDMKRIVSLFLCVLLILTLAACAGNNSGSKDPTDKENVSQGGSSSTEIYYLNFKPEISEVYDRIADDFKKETGITLKVVTAASDTYEQTLTSEIAKKDAPTIFQINGPIGYRSWKKYCADLKNTELYTFLSDKSLAIKDESGVYAIPYVVEAYGIIYNEDITDRYFELNDRQKEINSMEDIVSFESLKTVVEDMQKHKDTLEIDGVFASTSFSSGNQWRWTTHLANIPLYYEFAKAGEDKDPTLTGLAADEIALDYSDNFRDIFSLYIENSTTPKGLLGSKSVNDSMAEFALGKAAMVQNGTWAYSEIANVSGNKVDEDDVKMLPIYIGADGEENQGLCVGTENYIAVNSQVSQEKQEASIKFLEWLFSSETGKRYVTQELGFISPFNTFEDDEKPSDPLSKEALRWINDEGARSVPWIFTSFPSEIFKENLGSALLEFIQGSKDWDYVKQQTVSSWKTERENHK